MADSITGTSNANNDDNDNEDDGRDLTNNNIIQGGGSGSTETPSDSSNSHSSASGGGGGGGGDEHHSNPNPNSNQVMRRRLTKHRQSLLNIHNDMLMMSSIQTNNNNSSSSSKNDQSKIRHVVPVSPNMKMMNNHNNKKFNSTDNLMEAAPAAEATAAAAAGLPANTTTTTTTTTLGGGDGSPESWVEKYKQSMRETFLQPRSCSDWISTFVPLYRFLQKEYSWRNNLLTDILAGITVGVMIVPQSMSYAKLAGLPVEYGLYSSLVPIYAYALFGSSRQLAVGPVALVSLLLNTGLLQVMEKEGMTPDNTPNYDTIYATMALQTSFLVGVCFIVMGVLRMGFVTIFLSHAVVSGFTSAAAIIIGLSQLKYIFGYPIASDKSLQGLLRNLFAGISEFNYKTFLLGTSCVFVLMGLKKLAQKYPRRFKWTKAIGPLLVTVVSIVLQATMDLEARGIPIVGPIPKGFPEFAGDVVFPITDIGNLSIVILSIVIIGFMESIAIAKQLANKHNYELDSSMELVGLGMANMTSGLFFGYPVVGSFSRSAVNNDSGAQSGISAMVTATLVALTLLFLTPVFELLPLAVLASIVISGVISLVDYPEAIYLWKVHKFDFGVWMIAFLGTLFLGVELGLGIAVVLSLLLVIFESAYPHTAVLGRLPGTHQYRNIKQYPRAERYDGIVMVRIDAPIYFANTQHVREKIEKYYERAQEELEKQQQPQQPKQVVRYIILEMGAVSHVDTSALHILSDLNSNYKSTRQIQVCLANPNKSVMHRLVLSGLVDEIGREHIFVSLQDAVEHCLHAMDEIEMSTRYDEDPHLTTAELEELMMGSKGEEPTPSSSSSSRNKNEKLREVSDVEKGLLQVADTVTTTYSEQEVETAAASPPMKNL